MQRSMAQGYAAVANPLFYNANTDMHFGDAKTNIETLVQKVVYDMKCR